MKGQGEDTYSDGSQSYGVKSLVWSRDELGKARWGR